jgi:RimJ/RimL family protein N-acetyltransferase
MVDVASTTSDSQWLGSLPPYELGIYGLELSWSGDFQGHGRRLIHESLAQIDDEVPKLLQSRISIEGRPHADERRTVMAAGGAGTLDRNDRYYWRGCGPDNWAARMMAHLDPEDEPMWLVGFCVDDPIGYVAVARDDSWGSTIIHIGVVPGHRGNGYIADVLAGGSAAARSAGISAMLSDVDVVNEPMIRAMELAGHDPALRPWHTWTYRAAVRSLLEM